MELLSERLRKASKSIEKWIDSDDAIAIFDEYFSVPEGNESWGKDLAIGLNMIADEMERRYIPRPCFEDGEPVQFGDEIRHPSTGKSCIVKSIHVFDDGFYCFSHKGSHTSSCYTNGELVERPSKVLDADGAEIKVGDEGWDTRTGQPYEVLKTANYSLRVTDRVSEPKWIEVEHFTHEKPVFDANNERICKGDTVWHRDSGNEFVVYQIEPFEVFEKVTQISSTWFKPEHFTHRKPDSLEKLRDDINDYLTIAREDAGIKNTSPLDGWVDRLTALIERDA